MLQIICLFANWYSKNVENVIFESRLRPSKLCFLWDGILLVDRERQKGEIFRASLISLDSKHLSEML